MSTDEERRILESIKVSGYPLEADVTDQLIEKKWSVFPQYSFLDEKGQLRSVDLIASPSPLGTLFDVSGSKPPLLIVECKTSKHLWIFYCTHPKPFKTGFDDLRVRSRETQYDSILQQSPDYLKFKRNHRIIPEELSNKIFQTHLLDGSVPTAHSGHVVHQSIGSGKDHPDNFLKAVYQLRGAYWALPKDRRNRAVFLTIVLRGKLWEFNRIHNQNKVFPRQHLLYNTLMITQGTQHQHADTSPPSIIDIVIDFYFPNYLSLLEKDIQICKEIWEMGRPSAQHKPQNKE